MKYLESLIVVTSRHYSLMGAIDLDYPPDIGYLP